MEIVKRKKTKKNNAKLNNNLMVTALIVVGLALGISIIVLVTYTVYTKLIKVDTFENDIWEASAVEASAKLEGIVFKDINTDTVMYERMKEISDNYIANLNKESSGYARKEVEVTEEIYVDGVEKLGLVVIDGEEWEYAVIEEVKFKDAVLTTYINGGLDREALLTYVTEEGEIDVINRDELVQKVKMIEDDINGVERKTFGSKEIYESEYIQEVAKYIKDVFINGVDKKSDTSWYFTGDMLDYLENGIDQVYSDVEIEWIISGKNYTGHIHKDRIIMSINVIDGNGVIENIIMVFKINMNIRIYAMDIL